MKIRKNKPKYNHVSLQEMMAEIPKNNMPKSYDNDNFKNMYSGKLNGNQINRIQEIVNKISYISTWLNNLKLNQNTDINKPKTIPDSQNNINVSKPIPNKNIDSMDKKHRKIITHYIIFISILSSLFFSFHKAIAGKILSSSVNNPYFL